MFSLGPGAASPAGPKLLRARAWGFGNPGPPARPGPPEDTGAPRFPGVREKNGQGAKQE